MSFKFLEKSQLEKLSTQRLLNVLSSARAIISSYEYHAGPRCCEICHEYLGDNWQEDVVKPSLPFREYFIVIKSILATRENIPKHKSKNLSKPNLRHKRRKGKRIGLSIRAKEDCGFGIKRNWLLKLILSGRIVRIFAKECF